MTDDTALAQQARYDRIARGYARWWAPVLAPTAVRVLDLIAPEVEAGGTRILDVGTGTGTLPIAAIRRWPTVHVTAIDASGEMLEAAKGEVAAAVGVTEAARFEGHTSFADSLPFEDGAFDIAISSFVFQLVPSRARAFAEVARVLRPGGKLVFVTWLVSERWFPPDGAFDAALDDVGIGAREPEGRSGDLASVAAAAGGLRRAGFRSVRSTGDELVHAFDVESYAAFMSEFDEEDLISEMEPDLRTRFERRFRARLAELGRDAFLLRLPVVFATGTRP